MLLADRAFDADWLLLDLEAHGSKAVIPPKQSRLKQQDFDKEIYKWRHLIENLFCKLKDPKKVAMRAKKQMNRLLLIPI
ncbi:transposase [Psychrobacter pygoscelis]|uniref:transposase n=1 Tax=Psychrobacter pygoscelis TaxID=2488563 RepID=UPI001A95487B|nr:transposase [Psychrobacter pygoscelis]